MPTSCSDVRHRRDDARHGDGKREHAAAITRADEVGGRHVALTLRDAPQLREHDERERIDQDRIRQREEARCACAEHECGDGDERVGGVQVATQQEPRDDRAEAPAAEAPLFQMREIAFTPVRGDEAKDRDADEEQNEDEGCGGVHRAPPFERALVLKYTTAVITALISTHRS
jgi:hypothetical protein